jgi:hypothetical protein
MLLHNYFCDEWFWLKVKRNSKSFKNGIAKSLWGKKKRISLPSSPGSGPFGLLAHPPAGLLSLLSPPLPQAARTSLLGRPSWATAAAAQATWTHALSFPLVR